MFRFLSLNYPRHQWPLPARALASICIHYGPSIEQFRWIAGEDKVLMPVRHEQGLPNTFASDDGYLQHLNTQTLNLCYLPTGRYFNAFEINRTDTQHPYFEDICMMVSELLYNISRAMCSLQQSCHSSNIQYTIFWSLYFLCGSWTRMVRYNTSKRVLHNCVRATVRYFKSCEKCASRVFINKGQTISWSRKPEL